MNSAVDYKYVAADVVLALLQHVCLRNTPRLLVVISLAALLERDRSSSCCLQSTC
jgi:hypothetical protein